MKFTSTPYTVPSKKETNTLWDTIISQDYQVCYFKSKHVCMLLCISLRITVYLKCIRNGLISSVADMWERTITISSCGKTFSATGWQVQINIISWWDTFSSDLFVVCVILCMQVGWMVGPDRFIGPVQTLLPCVQFCTSAPAQDALCKALVKAAEPYEDASRLHMKHTHILTYIPNHCIFSYYEWLRCQFLRKKEILSEGLLSAGTALQ